MREGAFPPPFRLPLLSGVLVATGYIPFPPWALPFCFVPLWLFWLREPSTRRVLWGGWLAQFVLCGAAFHWIPRTVHDFGGLPWAAAIAALALFAASGHLFLVLAGLLFAVLRERFRLSPEAQRALLPFVTAACWYSVPMLFPWNLGYPWFAAGFPAFQLAEFVGFEGLGLLTLLLNLALLAAWERRRERAGALLLAGTAGFLLLLNGAGALTASRLPPPDATARILAVQGNIGSVEKARAESREDARIEVLKRYLRLTRRGLSEGGGPPDFAVWPETAYPEPLDEGATGRGLAVVLREFLRGHALPLATGAPGTEADGVRRTNSMVFLGADGAIADRRYDKTRLLAFGERIPLEGTFPGIRSWLPRAGGFAPGPGPGVRRLSGIRIGPQICYEGLFPGTSRELAAQGAQIFVNITNDSWFGAAAEPYQHLHMTMARGIEFRRPILRATNTGITAAMTADGSFLAVSPQDVEWVHLYEIPFRREPGPTFYQAYGCRLVPAFLWPAIAVIVIAGRKPLSPATGPAG